MTTSTIERLQHVFRDQFEDDAISITRDTTAADIEEWDSVLHIRLILAIEEAFGIRFSTTEVGDLTSVGDLVDRIDAHL
ncbi:MAG: acyl carrier protein [Rhodospirillales bacterium]